MARETRLQRLAREQRASRLAREADVVRELLPGWRSVRAEIRDAFLELHDRVEKARAEGIDPRPSWLHREERYQALLEQIDAQIGRLAEKAGRPVTALQRAALQRVESETAALVRIQLGPAGEARAAAIMKLWNRLPILATEQMIGRAADGTPLADLLAEIGPNARLQAAQQITAGVAAGRHPTVIARQLAGLTDASFTRTITIARTETAKAQWAASQLSLQSNRAITNGWIWEAELDERTCEACIFETGEWHPDTEVLDGHPNCRCAMIPQTRSWEELGLGDLGLGETSVEIPRGEDWFMALPEATQKTMLGPGKYEALRSGAIKPADLVAKAHSGRWGSMTRAASLREAKAQAAVRSA